MMISSQKREDKMRQSVCEELPVLHVAAVWNSATNRLFRIAFSGSVRVRGDVAGQFEDAWVAAGLATVGGERHAGVSFRAVVCALDGRATRVPVRRFAGSKMLLAKPYYARFRQSDSLRTLSRHLGGTEALMNVLRLLRPSRTIASAGLVVALSLFQLPMASADPMSDYTRMQIFRSMPRQLLLNSTLLYGDAAYRLERQRLGRERIQAGRASTMFARTASQAPTFFSSAWQGSDRENAVERFSEALKAFNQSAAGANVRLDDAAACTALAFAHAYAVRFGQMANERQRNDFAQQWRAWALRDPLYQGTDDAHRQLQLEQQEINSVLGNWFVWLSEHKPESGWTREDGLTTAEGVLKSAWTAPLDQLVLTNAGFRSRNATQQSEVPSQPQTGTSQSQTAASPQESLDSYRARGARIIAQGRATTRFALSATPIGSDTRVAQYWQLFLKTAEQRGLATNDSAQLQALAIAINFQVYSGRTLTDKQFAWALAAMKSDVLRDPAFQGSPSAQSQAWLETLAGDTISALVDMKRASNPAFSSKGDGTSGTPDGASVALAAQARLAAKKNLEKLFAPRVFDNYVLTEDGFAPRTGAQR